MPILCLFGRLRCVDGGAEQCQHIPDLLDLLDSSTIEHTALITTTTSVPSLRPPDLSNCCFASAFGRGGKAGPGEAAAALAVAEEVDMVFPWQQNVSSRIRRRASCQKLDVNVQRQAAAHHGLASLRHVRTAQEGLQSTRCKAVHGNTTTERCWKCVYKSASSPVPGVQVQFITAVPARQLRPHRRAGASGLLEASLVNCPILRSSGAVAGLLTSPEQLQASQCIWKRCRQFSYKLLRSIAKHTHCTSRLVAPAATGCITR